ncbi:MAG TPA: hypothetical protein DEB30_04010 [Candidatus Peribacter riflensis]|uniref:Uncharacterized protein n=1 Tax=Candidatus Peribacter riflensis TaxID=1735162 RepID=A0A0S1SI24_9BACT|nr:MAG: hypothetical protein PeribacterA2_0737 [Candidatus Peribacter riflensis]OGJ77790.1 MAG: hypothetical protein A2398_00775 [Candidatus Peribacteria bacterium RIFOXYB1_FULL_57_12]ALM11204.1 MAG: hypothetical protein PeribacterB2_0738 [Candidatus Peribacter riflensis]ALM12307.1 MAG: hypothetical protein PeribacterC2_0738 [Candidatus Peribacter riflensis]ALM13409.1 MAG: hypothetical protein PeribacterD1_0738 [Candidatus Peribacter riflensis]
MRWCLYNGHALSKKLPLLRATVITFLALLGGALLVSAFTVIITSLKSYTLTPTDLLPAKGTVLLFSAIDDVEVRRYEDWLPILRSLPSAEVPRTIAVIALPDAGNVVVLFARRPVPPDALPTGERWTQRDLGPLTVAASSPEIFPLLQQSEQSLSASQAFRQLSRGEMEKQSWIFVSRLLLPPPVSFADTLMETVLFRGTTHIGLFPGSGSGMTIRLFPASVERRSLPLPALPATPQTSFSIALARPESSIRMLRDGLSQNERAVFETNILTFLQQTFGDDISMEYDVLPLLAKPARLTFARTASGTSALLLQGQAADADLRLTRLHEAFRGSRTTASVVIRVFENGRYTFRNVRDDSHLLTEERFAVGEWQVHTTVHATQEAFCSALRGTTFILATDCSVLTLALTLPPDQTEPAALAAGILSRSPSSALPSLLGTHSPLLPPQAAPLRWSLTRQGDILTLTLLSLPQ